MHKLKTPFYTTKETGSGLGLMVSHRIMVSHQGMIDIMSKVGKGTTNEVILLPTACSGEVTKSS